MLNWNMVEELKSVGVKYKGIYHQRQKVEGGAVQK